MAEFVNKEVKYINIGEPISFENKIELIERYIPEIEDKVPDVASAVKGFIGIWKAEQEKQNEAYIRIPRSGLSRAGI